MLKSGQINELIKKVSGEEEEEEEEMESNTVHPSVTSNGVVHV